jgi:hypothetical protein
LLDLSWKPQALWGFWNNQNQQFSNSDYYFFVSKNPNGFILRYLKI